MTDIRFHLDESVDPAVADGLRRRGADVSTSQESGLLGASDSRQLSFALSQRRVLVTHDEDFLVNAGNETAHAGIAFCHCETRSIGQLIAALLLIRDCLSAEDMRNHVEFL